MAPKCYLWSLENQQEQCWAQNAIFPQWGRGSLAPVSPSAPVTSSRKIMGGKSQSCNSVVLFLETTSPQWESLETLWFPVIPRNAWHHCQVFSRCDVTASPNGPNTPRTSTSCQSSPSWAYEKGWSADAPSTSGSTLQFLENKHTVILAATV